MAKALFEFMSYRDYLAAALPKQGEERGARARLSEYLNVQKGFVSAVLHGKSGFSLEQAFRVSQFLKHTDEEREYFLLLVQYARAGSKDLERWLEGRLREIMRRRREIREHVRATSELSEADRIEYYSTWHYAAVHMCVLVPGLRTRAAIAAYLGIPAEKVAAVLEFLVRAGLAEPAGDGFASGSVRIHIGADSPFVARHHTNWRIRAVSSLDGARAQDIHYSSVMSISHSAAAKIRELLLAAVKEMEPEIHEAKDEAVYALTFDLFDLQAG